MNQPLPHAELIAQHEAQPIDKELAANPWKLAIDTELVNALLGTADTYDAKTGLQKIIDWHVAVALDPTISSDAQALVDRGRAEAQKRDEQWTDTNDEWSEAISAAHPIHTNAHEAYATAMKMVSNRRSKAELVELVCWLLQRAAQPTVNEKLLESLRMAVLQNNHDMLMTGDELRTAEAAIAKATRSTP